MTDWFYLMISEKLKLKLRTEQRGQDYRPLDPNIFSLHFSFSISVCRGELPWLTHWFSLMITKWLLIHTHNIYTNIMYHFRIIKISSVFSLLQPINNKAMQCRALNKDHRVTIEYHRIRKHTLLYLLEGINDSYSNGANPWHRYERRNILNPMHFNGSQSIVT